MSYAEPRLIQSKVLQAIAVAIFIMLLALPMLGQALSIGTDVETFEKRRSAEWPRLPQNFRELDAWPRQFDAWLKDHFGFRNQLVLAYNVIRVEALRQSTSPLVLLGRKDWLFFRGDQTIEQARGTAHFSPADLDRWIDVMERRQVWLAERGIPMLMVAIPNKERVYREYLPKWVRPSYPETHLDQINRRLSERKSPLLFMDLTPALVAAKQKSKVYLKADTHWTIETAFTIGYRNITDWVKTYRPELRTLEHDEVAAVSVMRTGYNLDLARLLGLASVMSEPEIDMRISQRSYFKSNEELNRGGGCDQHSLC